MKQRKQVPCKDCGGTGLVDPPPFELWFEKPYSDDPAEQGYRFVVTTSKCWTERNAEGEFVTSKRYYTRVQLPRIPYIEPEPMRLVSGADIFRLGEQVGALRVIAAAVD